MAKGIVLGSVLFLFSVCSHAAVLSPNKTKVVILGAGIAGITALKDSIISVEEFTWFRLATCELKRQQIGSNISATITPSGN